MTAHSQFTSGSYKYVDPSNYSTGKTGCEVTIHWSIAEGASVEEQQAMDDRGRVEAIRLATGADRPYAQAASPAFAAGMTEVIVPPTPAPPAAQPPVGVVESPVIVAPTVEPGPTLTLVSNGPLSLPGMTAVTVADTSAPAATTTSPSPEAAPAANIVSDVGITDKDLVDAATHHSARIMAAAPKDQVSQELTARKVSNLITTFVPAGQRLTAIPQERRQKFLDGLAAL